jgi:hypothetical protein
MLMKIILFNFLFNRTAKVQVEYSASLLRIRSLEHIIFLFKNPTWRTGRLWNDRATTVSVQRMYVECSSICRCIDGGNCCMNHRQLQSHKWNDRLMWYCLIGKELGWGVSANQSSFLKSTSTHRTSKLKDSSPNLPSSSPQSPPTAHYHPQLLSNHLNQPNLSHLTHQPQWYVEKPREKPTEDL